MARAVRLTEAAPCFGSCLEVGGVCTMSKPPRSGARSVDVVVAASPVLAPGTKSAESETTSAAMRDSPHATSSHLVPGWGTGDMSRKGWRSSRRPDGVRQPTPGVSEAVNRGHAGARGGSSVVLAGREQ